MYIAFMKKNVVGYTLNPNMQDLQLRQTQRKLFFIEIMKTLTSFWIYPPPGNSHHQDLCTFSRESL